MSLETLLQALEEGDIVTFNYTGNANSTGELTVTVPASSDSINVMFEDNTSVYSIREHDGELVLYQGEPDSAYAPERHYDTIETMEFVAEP